MTSPILVAYGAGTNSTAMLVEMQRREMRPDAIVFADTGGEEPRTYAYLDTVRAWLERAGFPPITVVRRQHDNQETLEANCLRFGKLPSVAYGYKTCSQEYKRRPQERWARTWPAALDAWAAGLPVIKALGYDADEPYRRDRIEDSAKYRHIFPLIDADMGRHECRAMILSAGLPLPGKSSCFFCPNRRPSEVLALHRRSPDLSARAIAIERRAKAQDVADGKLSMIVGLARRWTWESIIDGGGRQCDLFAQEMPCDCYDGEE